MHKNAQKVKSEKLGAKFPATTPGCSMVMHQSIPMVPTPPGNRGAFAHVVSPGGGAFAIVSRLWRLGIRIHRGDPRAFDTRVFERRMSLSGRTRSLSKTGLSIRV